MAQKLAEAFVELRAETKRLQGDMAKAQKITKGGFAKIVKIAAAAGTVMIAALGIRALFRGVRGMLQAAIEGEETFVVLKATLEATGHAAGFTADELQAMASQLQGVTKFSDEAIKETMAIVATFKKIKGDIFKDAVVSILDMATVLKQDARQGAIQLGKALNDPILGVTALGRAGIQFTVQQKEMIKQLVETGRVAAAQGMIMDELKGQMGGAAFAAATTLGGKLTILKNAWADLQEVMGLAIFKGMRARALFDKLSEGMKGLEPIGKAIGKALGVAIRFSIATIMSIKPLWGILLDAFKMYVNGVVAGFAKMAETFGKFIMQLSKTKLVLKGLGLTPEEGAEMWFTGVQIKNWGRDTGKKYNEGFEESASKLKTRAKAIFGDIGKTFREYMELEAKDIPGISKLFPGLFRPGEPAKAVMPGAGARGVTTGTIAATALAGARFRGGPGALPTGITPGFRVAGMPRGGLTQLLGRPVAATPTKQLQQSQLDALKTIAENTKDPAAVLG